MIEVRIPRSRLRFDNEIHANLIVLEELRAAGIETLVDTRFASMKISFVLPTPRSTIL